MPTEGEEKLDPAVVAELYLKYAEELRAFLIGVLRNRELAGEALQATFTKAMESGHTARQETQKGWLFRVAFHEAMAFKRRHKVQEKAYWKLAGDQKEVGRPAEDHLVRWEQVDRVRVALADLPPEQQVIVNKRIYEEKTFAVIAAELNLPLGTVLTRMRLALKKLQQKFHETE